MTAPVLLSLQAFAQTSHRPAVFLLRCFFSSTDHAAPWTAGAPSLPDYSFLCFVLEMMVPPNMRQYRAVGTPYDLVRFPPDGLPRLEE
jgi:hypothetical protein